MFKLELGQKVKDRVTGFKGVIVCRCDYLTGCRRYAVQAQKIGKDGKVGEWTYFDEDLLVLDGKNINHEIRNPAGPPRSEAPQR